MLGTVAFIQVMTVVIALTWLWMSGRLPVFIEEQREKIRTIPGRTVEFDLWKWHFSVNVNRSFWVRVAFMLLGPAAIMGLTIAYAELIPLHIVFVIYVLPAYLTMFVLGIVYPEYGKRALVGASAGILATLLYDVVRMLAVVALGLPDPIPHIGALWLGEAGFGTNMWWVGYLWRFFGNGLGMGIVYAMLPKFTYDFKGGWIYGEIIGLGMFAAMFLFPAVQIHLFPLNEVVFINGILGHWAYGMTLGYIFERTKLVKEFESHSVITLRE